MIVGDTEHIRSDNVRTKVKTIPPPPPPLLIPDTTEDNLNAKHHHRRQRLHQVPNRHPVTIISSAHFTSPSYPPKRRRTNPRIAM